MSEHLKKHILLLILTALPAKMAFSGVENLTKLSKEFIKEVHLSSKVSSSKIEKVIYGHKKVGFFQTDDFKRLKNGVRVTLVPPLFEYPTLFFVKLKSGRILEVNSRKFDSPKLPMFQGINVDLQSGTLGSPFYLTNGALPRKLLINPGFRTLEPDFYKKNSNRFTFLMVINRLGEIVWVHVPTIDGSLFGSYISSKKVGEGYFGIMFGKHSGYFEVVRYDGKVLRKFSSRDAKVPFAMHHDFETIGSKKLYAVGNRVADLFDYTKNPSDRGKTFLTDTVIGINLENETSKILRDFLKEFHPGKTPYYTGDLPGDKKFAVWDKPKVDLDFLHINGVEYVEGKGVVVSFRNISKVGLLDESFKNMRWTLGAEPKDTFYIASKEDRFHHQHTPNLLKNGQVLLFDNAAGKRHSRAIRYRLNKKDGTAIKTWAFRPKERMYAKDRSSVYPLPDGNYGVYFVNPRMNGSMVSVIPHRDIYYEVSSKSASADAEPAVLSKLVITYGVASPGYRFMPIDGIGKEKAVTFGEFLKLSQMMLDKSPQKRSKRKISQ